MANYIIIIVGFKLRKDIVIPSEERHIKMYPLDFEEFCNALGESLIINYIRKCFKGIICIPPYMTICL